MLPPRHGKVVSDGWVDYVRLDTPQSMYAVLNKLWAHQPVLLQGTPLVAGLVGRWSFQHLVSPGVVLRGTMLGLVCCVAWPPTVA